MAGKMFGNCEIDQIRQEKLSLLLPQADYNHRSCVINYNLIKISIENL